MLDAVAGTRGGATAVEEADGVTVTYQDLVSLSDRLRDRLASLGVRRGDRVGIYLRKSIDAVAAQLGSMKAGAAYVPVDPFAPAWRCAYILNDCSVRAVIIEEAYVPAFQAEVAALGGRMPALIVLSGVGGGHPLAAALDALDAVKEARPSQTVPCTRDDLAYILYTSGSTGKPKGVMLSHGNALSFVEWLASTFDVRETDRFSAHAPFHFDLSILDLYLCFHRGGTLVLIGAELGREPGGLGEFIAAKRITVWYSAPSILSLLAQFGKLERYDWSNLRLVFFAGEVFPVRYLRILSRLWPRARYFNLYGPTETNVCTWYEIPLPIPAERTEPYPIGHVCANLLGKVVDEAGCELPPGAEGELCISGPNVMQGYWNLPEQSARAFLVDSDGVRWYRTGDMVVKAADGTYVFTGRRDRMVKRRGHRVELNEIEVGLYRHEGVKEAAVVALPDTDRGVRIRAFVAMKDGSEASVIDMKRFSAEHLPSAMIPDDFVFLPALPKTSTDKIDYQTLAGM
ncbi:MAG TPA: amino acid adenylation domain-containing protein [Gemmatimonadales bacterium]|nr:amino acid adenylation domain-containing protein [Gemmatimonadales bacterium]